MPNIALKWHTISTGDGVLWVLASNDEIVLYRAQSPYDCKHPEKQWRDYETSNGGWQRKEQCLVCGKSVSQPKKRDTSEVVPPWDRQLEKNWFEDCNERRSNIETLWIERTANLETEGYAFYEDYLRSEEWTRKRSLVLRRDEGRCQACLSADASEVHHHTYDHIFSEYLFELVAVCRDCHERLHSWKIAGIEAAKAKGLAHIE